MKVKDLIKALEKLSDQEGEVTIMYPCYEKGGEGLIEYGIDYFIIDLAGKSMEGEIALVPEDDPLWERGESPQDES